jgi:hypothetical protein
MAATTNLSPVAVITQDGVDGDIHIFPRWEGVDRPETGGWAVGPQRAILAKRLAAAINAGVVCTNPVVKTDVNGKTYVSHDHGVMGRRMNADLKRLGF